MDRNKGNEIRNGLECPHGDGKCPAKPEKEQYYCHNWNTNEERVHLWTRDWRIGQW